MRHPREPEFVEDIGHLAQQDDCLSIRFAEFDPERVQHEHYPLGEPATPDGVGGFVGVLDNVFSFRDCFSGKKTDFRSHNAPSLRFHQR